MCFSAQIISVSSSGLTLTGPCFSCTEDLRAECSVPGGVALGWNTGTESPSHPAALYASQDMTGLQAWECTLLGRVGLLVNPHTRVIFLRPSFRLWIWVERVTLHPVNGILAAYRLRQCVIRKARTMNELLLITNAQNNTVR